MNRDVRVLQLYPCRNVGDVDAYCFLSPKLFDNQLLNISYDMSRENIRMNYRSVRTSNPPRNRGAGFGGGLVPGRNATSLDCGVVHWRERASSLGMTVRLWRSLLCYPEREQHGPQSGSFYGVEGPCVSPVASALRKAKKRRRRPRNPPLPLLSVLGTGSLLAARVGTRRNGP